MPIFPKKTSAEKMYNTKKPLNYGGQSGNRKTVQEGYARINTSNMPQFRGGTAPGFGRVSNIVKAFSRTPGQYLSRSGFVGRNILSGISQQIKKLMQNPKSFTQQVKSSRKTTREKVTKMPESFFKNVEKQMRNNPNLKQSSPGYFTFKK